MDLCFGVYISALIKARASASITNQQLVYTVVGTIDPDNKYADRNNDSSVSHLVNGAQSFPVVALSGEGAGVVKRPAVSLTSVMRIFRDVDSDALAEKFAENVLPLLSHDKKAALIVTLRHAAEEDNSLRGANRKTFETCMGMDLEQALSPNHPVVLPRFLAGMFLYTLYTNDNAKKSQMVRDIRAYFDQLENPLAEYTDEWIPGFTPAPDTSASYLAKLQNKYGMVTPLIYRGVPHPFYDIYVPGAVTWNGKQADSLDIRSLLKISRNVIFTGTGGRGKSMLMRHLLLDAVAHYDETRLVPVFISVKDFDGRIPDILQCAHAFTRNLWPELSMDELRTIFIDGKAILLFDGLDEIRPDLLSMFTASLNAFLDRYTDNAVILSSRPYGNFASFSRFTPVTLEPFSIDQAVCLIAKLDYPTGQPEVNQEFQSMLRSGLYETHEGLADNPLLLSIMLMTYATYHEVPSEAYRLFEMAFYVLAKLHDDSKDNFTRSFSTGWSVDTIADRFSYFCAITYRDGVTTFARDAMARYFSRLTRHYGADGVDVSQFITDLCANICLMTEDRGSYAFIHRSFQEYFCARFFYMQDAKQLEKVIPLFDRMDETRRDDRTLLMLHDMAPDAVRDHIFLPYLNGLMEECSGSDGIWVFLKRLYRHLDCADGDRRPEHPYPDSLLYSAICSIYGIHHAAPDPGAYPVLDHDSLDIYVRREDSGEIVNVRRLPPEYVEKHGKPEVTGRIYRFDWDALKKSEDGRAAVMNPSGPFVCELDEIRMLYERLKGEAPAGDEPDPFEDMF